MSPAPRLLAILAALMGAGGVALAALAAHAGGGVLGETAALFLLLHAAAALAVSAHARLVPDAGFALGAGFALAAGAILFAGDLAWRAFFGAGLFPLAAPAGGSLMIAAWLALAAAFALARRPPP
jgi:uncharacterized membrane protein YgdD (TMEM256/DUF423 family)